MSGYGIDKSVNQAFKAFGSIFFFAGILVGVLLYDSPPEILQLYGTIETVKVQQYRPLGFEHITLDSTDPEHQNIPIQSHVQIKVSYSYNNTVYEAFIGGSDLQDHWIEGGSLSLWILPEEPEYPYDVDPTSDVQGGCWDIIAGGGLSLMGLLLVSVVFFSERKKKKDHLYLVEAVSILHRRGPALSSFFDSESEDLDQIDLSGNKLMGGVLLVIGAAFLLSSGGAFAENPELTLQIALWAIPLTLGTALVFLGLKELFPQKVYMQNGDLNIVKGLFKKLEKIPLREFIGIGESIIVQTGAQSSRRVFFKEYFLIHPDLAKSGYPVLKLREKVDSLEKLNKLSQTLALPLVQIENDAIQLFYPDGTLIKEGSLSLDQRSYVSEEPFPGKYCTLHHSSEAALEVRRPYGKSVYIGIPLLLGGLLPVIFGVYPLVIPLGMMGAVFIGIAFKKDVLKVDDGQIILIESFGKTIYAQRKVYFDQVRQVRIGADKRRNMARSLIIVTDREELAFGQACTKGELAWIQDKIMDLMKIL